MCAYIPPEHSPYYTHTGFECGIDIFEEILVDNFLCKNDMYALICGDLNSRTANKVPDVDQDETMFTFTAQPDTAHTVTRQSQDTDMNSYGKLLLNICSGMGSMSCQGQVS